MQAEATFGELSNTNQLTPIMRRTVTNPLGSSGMRVQQDCEHGFGKLVEAPWNPKLHRRIVRVPSGSHDDQVDAASGVSRVVARLRRPEGAAVAAIIKTTGWQQHSVRGFVAGVAHKKPKLTSTSRDGERIYRIVDAKQRKPKAARQYRYSRSGSRWRR